MPSPSKKDPAVYRQQRQLRELANKAGHLVDRTNFVRWYIGDRCDFSLTSLQCMVCNRRGYIAADLARSFLPCGLALPCKPNRWLRNSKLHDQILMQEDGVIAAVKRIRKARIYPC